MAETTVDDCDVYRFPPVLTAALALGAVVMSLVGIGIYRSYDRPLEIYEMVFVVGIFGAFTLITLAQLWVVVRFRLELRVGSLTVSDWRGRRVIPTDEIRKVAIAYPWRGRGYLDLFDGAGRRLERIDGGLQGFDEVAAFVIGQCAAGTVLRENVPGEKWTERTVGGARE